MQPISNSTRSSKILFFFIILLSFSSAKAQYTDNSVFGNLLECDTMSRGIYLVWWDTDFDYSNQIDILLDSMVSYRNTCLNELNMVDPPNPLDGYYYNIYIHNPNNSNDIFYQYGWANGQGTDFNGYPYLTLPNGLVNDWVNNSHEAFHIFQYNATSPGFAYSSNSQWYIEATASWFAAKQNINAPRAFIEAESLVHMPNVPLWLSYDNFPSFYPNNWQRYVRQYGLALFLYYLTDVDAVPDTLVVSGFFNGTSELPQEYLFNHLGSEMMRSLFIDWASHMTNNFDFIFPYQANANEEEWNSYADPLDDNEFIQIYNNSGSNGWYQPDDEAVTNAWSFNTYKVLNSNIDTYTFEINGNLTGTLSGSAYFRGKVLVQNSVTGTSFYDLNMSNDLQGSLSLSVTANDTSLYFIIASMPGIFQDNSQSFQLFPYQMRISSETTPDVLESAPQISKLEIARYNLLGQKTRKDDHGIQIILFNDGTRKKIYSPR